jgi:ribosomal protein L37AE/L43A
MSVSRLEYLGRFLDHVDFVISGKKNAISEDKWLVNNYCSLFYDVVSKHLLSPDIRVRADVVNLLAAVRERRSIDVIRGMRASDKDVVKTACLGYLSAIGESDTLIPDLFDILEHKNDDEFKRAAMKMTIAGRSEDVPRLRKIYGQVIGEMRDEIKRTLTAIIDKDDALKKNKELLLSVPVFPDERKFVSFLDTSITYLDIRYRDSVSCKDKITQGTYVNVYNALKKIRTRVFNEFDNLSYYGKETKKMYDELMHLIEWASADLSEKTVKVEEGMKRMTCPGCDSEMRYSGGVWVCIDCGMKKG